MAQRCHLPTAKVAKPSSRSTSATVAAWLRDVAADVRVAAVEVGDGAHPHGVVVPAGQERGPRGRAERGHVEVGVAESAGGQPVDVGGGQVRAIAAEVGEAGVVEEDDHHVGGVVARVRWRRPPGRRLGLGAPDDTVEAFVARHVGPPVAHGSAGGPPGRPVVRGCVTGRDDIGGPARCRQARIGRDPPTDADGQVDSGAFSRRRGRGAWNSGGGTRDDDIGQPAPGALTRRRPDRGAAARGGPGSLGRSAERGAGRGRDLLAGLPAAPALRGGSGLRQCGGPLRRR